MNKEHGIVICPGITVSDNYNRLTNKPQINGFTLTGNNTAASLNLLSNQIGEYEEISVAQAGSDSFVLVFPTTGSPSKVKLGDIKAGTFTTAEETVDPEELEVGEFIFKKLEE